MHAQSRDLLKYIYIDCFDTKIINYIANMLYLSKTELIIHCSQQGDYPIIAKRCELYGFSAIQNKYYYYYYYLTAMSRVKGLCKDEKNSKNPRLLWKWVGGWVDPGLTRIFFLENRPKIVLHQY